MMLSVRSFPFVVTFFLVAFLVVTAGFAQGEAKQSDMQKKIAVYQQDMARIEAKLNAVNTMVSTFTQVAANGEQSNGVLYISRPGKLRWEYKKPTPLQIIAKGSMLVYYDVELDQVSHVSLDDTLASFLIREKIRFHDKDIEIHGFTKNESEIVITVAKRGTPEEGLLTLAFGSTSLELQRMEVVDPTKNRTVIFFESSVYGVPVDEKLFILPKFRGN